jgi:hypothetical protein
MNDFHWNGPKPVEREPQTWWMHPEQLEQRVQVGEITVTQDGTYLFRNGDVAKSSVMLPRRGYFKDPNFLYPEKESP